ncbi:MoxR family ATPase [Ktedonosporobacter rubrisoli]|uniref:MoxR family ATPase n=1 Tax=Ktedonosporobacter rubrisoli TaxID=2509675 RepID=A0A4P6JVN9_KTERU|nr:MoxR family ATPase [Ktedonosporobacter rubrisoli]QBD79410.1 MoxR family ATPase [Ktedonosporobacter rubrisoli]
MTPGALARFLHKLVEERLMFSTMIWGPPGIGKSSIVAQTARAFDMGIIDLRLSQLAPTDLRGLPVAEDGISRWYPPEFLPRDGKGILFLDELNLAPPAMQGMAQQLILDRRVGSYTVPPDWFIWAAGNRKEDRAAVFEMPAPLANRFIHLVVEPHFESFKSYALAQGIHEHILAFLSFRPALLHEFDPQQPAWPSPRTWMVANRLYKAGLDIAPVVGLGATAEFEAFRKLYNHLPDVEKILAGNGNAITFPDEPSVRYAIIMALNMRATDIQGHHQAFLWVAEQASPEWIQLFATDLFRLGRARNQMGKLATLVQRDTQLQRMFKEFMELLS